MVPPLSPRIKKTSFYQNCPQLHAKDKLDLFNNRSFQSQNCANTISRSHSTKKKHQTTHILGTPSSLENSALLKIYFFSPSAHLLPTKSHHKISPTPPTMFKFQHWIVNKTSLFDTTGFVSAQWLQHGSNQ